MASVNVSESRVNKGNVDFRAELARRASDVTPDFQISYLDMLQLQSMYLPVDPDEYPVGNMRVAVDSVVYRVLMLLGRDRGFAAAMHLPDCATLSDLPCVQDNETLVMYITDVPSECVWCALDFINSMWYDGIERGRTFFLDNIDAEGLKDLLYRLSYSTESIATLMKQFALHPDAVLTVLNEMVGKSVHTLIANEYAKKASEEKARAEFNGEREKVSEHEREIKPLKPLKQPVVIHNAELRERLCTEIRTLMRQSKAADMLCEHVSDILTAYARNDMQIANMDQVLQSRLLNGAIATAIIFCYTLSGPENSFASRMMDVLTFADIAKAAEEAKENATTSEADAADK